MGDRIQILGVYPSKAGQAGSSIGRVDFVFLHDGMAPLRVVRRYNAEKDVKKPADWKEATVCEIASEKANITVRGAQLFEAGQDGMPFIMADVKAPADIRNEVAAMALLQYAKRQEHKSAQPGPAKK